MLLPLSYRVTLTSAAQHHHKWNGMPLLELKDIRRSVAIFSTSAIWLSALLQCIFDS